MSSQEMKLFAFQPKDYGQYSFFVMAADENEASETVERYIKETFSSARKWQGKIAKKPNNGK